MATSETTWREFGGHETLHLRFRPASYTARFYVRDARRVVAAIEAMPEGSARDYLLGVETDGVLPDPAGEWGEIVLTVRAVDEHSAERATRKILEKVTIS